MGKPQPQHTATKSMDLIFVSAVIWYPRTQNLSNDVFYNQSISITAYIFKLKLSTIPSSSITILTHDGFLPSECTRSHTYLYGIGVYSLSRQYVERREVQAAREDPVGTRCSSAREKNEGRNDERIKIASTYTQQGHQPGVWPKHRAMKIKINIDKPK